MIEDALIHEGIPYQIYGALRFYDRMEVKDILAYVRLLLILLMMQVLDCVVNIPTRVRKDHDRHRGKIRNHQRPDDVGSSGRVDCERCCREQPNCRVLMELMTELRSYAESARLPEVVRNIVERTHYFDHLHAKFPDAAAEKIENVHELVAAVAEYAQTHPESGLAEWLSAQSLREEDDDEEAVRGVRLMTLHSAKGLEFDRVFISGVEDGLLPHRNSQDHEEDIEEERRLLYVGMTRAKEKLSLFAVRQRSSYAQMYWPELSRFVLELPTRCV